MQPLASVFEDDAQHAAAVGRGTTMIGLLLWTYLFDLSIFVKMFTCLATVPAYKILQFSRFRARLLELHVLQQGDRALAREAVLSAALSP